MNPTSVQAAEMIENLKFEVKEMKQYCEHLQKIVTKLQTENKKVRLEHKQVYISMQTFKDKVEELENIIDSMKETA